MHETLEYPYQSSEPTTAHRYLLPALLRILSTIPMDRVFEVGCGNGAVASELDRRGYSVVGVDASASGIAHARAAFPQLELYQGDAYQDLAARYGRFPIVISLEVVEHVYDPRLFVRRCYDLVDEGGSFILSTPFHGYWKNLAMALTGKMDAHFTALWDGGHIKFWSEQTLSTLMTEVGFNNIQFSRVGRIPPLAKSVLAIAKRS